MLGRLDLVTLVVDDVPLCAAFYREVLGFRPRGKFSSTYVEFENEGVRFHLIQRSLLPTHTGESAHAQARRGQTIELALRLKDRAEIDQVYLKCAELGAQAVRSPAMMPWGEYTAFIADPDGNVVALFSQE